MPGVAFGRAADDCSWFVVWQRRNMLGRKTEAVRVSVSRVSRGEFEKVFRRAYQTAPYLSLRENARNGARGCQGVGSGVYGSFIPNSAGRPDDCQQFGLYGSWMWRRCSILQRRQGAAVRGV